MSMSTPSSTSQLISSLPQYQTDMASELCEYMLKNEVKIIHKDCSVLTLTNCFMLKLHHPYRDFLLDIISYTINLLLPRHEFNEKYFSYEKETIKSTKTAKSKILLVMPLTRLDDYNKKFKSWGLSIYTISDKSDLKKISEISDDIILIRDSYTRYVTINNFFDVPYQLYVFLEQSTVHWKFYNMISGYCKSKVDINSYLLNMYRIETLNKKEYDRNSPMNTDKNNYIEIKMKGK